jgi:hypothetical protein
MAATVLRTVAAYPINPIDASLHSARIIACREITSTKNLA